MNILICDDIRAEALKLERAIKETLLQAVNIDADIRYFEKGKDVLDYIKTGAHIDVCFLDIIMPEMDGIELARNMRTANFNGKIVFLTTSKEYGVESYQVKAYSYLLKPVNTNEVARLLHEINNGTYEDTAQLKQRAGIKIETRNMTKFIYFYEISFVEVINKNVYFRLFDGSDVVLFASLNDFLPQLMEDGRFAQCHRSFVVNMDAITQIRGKEIIFRCGRRAPISRNHKEFSKMYFMRIFEGDKQNS